MVDGQPEGELTGPDEGEAVAATTADAPSNADAYAAALEDDPAPEGGAEVEADAEEAEDDPAAGEPAKDVEAETGATAAGAGAATKASSKAKPKAKKTALEEPVKKKIQSKRVTPAGGPGNRPPVARSKGSHKAHRVGDDAGSSTRYTPPARHQMPSPTWVPVLMFALLIIGALVIVLNYVGALGGVSNVKLVIGLGFILGGIITATQYR